MTFDQSVRQLTDWGPKPSCLRWRRRELGLMKSGNPIVGVKYNLASHQILIEVGVGSGHASPPETSNCLKEPDLRILLPLRHR